jgi:hypothetical protein
MLLCLLALPGSSWAFTTDGQEDICATAAVIFCENFEDRTAATSGPGVYDMTRSKYKNNGWGLSRDYGMGVTTATAYDGSKSYNMHYNAVSVPWPNINAGGTGFLDTNFSSAQSELYYRWQVKWGPGWVVSPVSGKHLEIDFGYVGHLWSSLFGSNAPVFVTQLSSGTVNHYPSPSTPVEGVDQAWHCMEAHVKMNTTLGGTDGVLEGWVDSVQRINKTNINISTQRTTQSVLVMSGYWNCLTNDNVSCTSSTANNHPAMDRYIDNIVVSTSRVGCNTFAPGTGDITPPTTPTNVTASATVPLQNTVSWTASSDASLVTYTITYCTGAACTPATTLTTTTATGATHTGLTGGTLYRYRVRATDASGNVSSESSITEVTALSAAAAGSLSITSDGRFAISGTTTFLLGVSYFDALSYRTADLDTLAARGLTLFGSSPTGGKTWARQNQSVTRMGRLWLDAPPQLTP